jgi:hypothetical protein
MPANLRLALGAAAGAGNRPQAMPATLQSYELLPDREEFVAPQPLRATLLAVTPALVVGTLGATGAASAGLATAAGGVLLALAGIRGGYAWFDARRCRLLADRLLRTHPRSTITSPLTDWRATQLTSERTRRRLVRGVQSLTRAAEIGLRSPPSPLARHALERSLFVLRRLEWRLGDLSRPVSPYGILVVGELVEGASSPFSRPERAGELPDASTEALAALDVLR